MHNQRQRSDGLDTFFLFQESLPDRAKFEVKFFLVLEGVFMRKSEFKFNIYSELPMYQSQFFGLNGFKLLSNCFLNG